MTDCKSLAPTWEKLAQDFASEPGVLIAKVDCEAENAKATAQEAGVKSYPTINYYPKGSKEPVPYQGGRSENDLVKFMNEKAGTHRMAGGALDSLAGTVPSLDSLVASLKDGGDAAYTAFEKAASAVQDKYGEYYAKVAKKLQSNQDYAVKEFNRLQGMVKKGGLAPEKVDELTTRSNILSKFLGEEQAAHEEL
jgi:protein disulfide-isomerase A6